jgi:hypothetical protein
MEELLALLDAAKKETDEVVAAKEGLATATQALNDAQSVVAEKQTAADEARRTVKAEGEQAITAWQAVQAWVATQIASLQTV